MTRTYNPKRYIEDSFSIAREQFALRKSIKGAAKLLRAAMNAADAGLIDTEEGDSVILDVIKYLESI